MNVEDKDLIKWLMNNSSGIYRPSLQAAWYLEEIATALVDVLDGEADHDIHRMTGLNEVECKRIHDARCLAERLIGRNGSNRRGRIDESEMPIAKNDTGKDS